MIILPQVSQLIRNMILVQVKEFLQDKELLNHLQ